MPHDGSKHDRRLLGEWECAPVEREPERTRLIHALYTHRAEVLAHYPWVQLPSDRYGTSTPVGALLTAWERWDALRGRCPDCGGLVLGLKWLNALTGSHRCLPRMLNRWARW